MTGTVAASHFCADGRGVKPFFIYICVNLATFNSGGLSAPGKNILVVSLKIRLSVLFFLQFATWGSYLTSMGNYLASVSIGDSIGYFYSIQGIVSIFMPTLFGILADRKIEAQRLLGISHIVAALLMFAEFAVCTTAEHVDFATAFPLYALSVAFYMPTLGLSNSVSYTAMQGSGLDKVADFPRIRIFGTVGFIVAMWIVDLMGFQQTPVQFLVSGIWGLALGAYSFSMPHCPVKQADDSRSFAERMGLDAFRLMKSPRMFLFFFFSMMLGMALQVTNGYASPFIASFANLPEYADAYFAQHANLLYSLSQVSETLCILLIPFFLKRYGIKVVMLISMTAWVLRFGFFGIGSPEMPGIIALVLSMIVYGVAFDFFNISGSLFVDGEVEPSMRSSAQGLFMRMTNGLGAAIGTTAAQAVVNHFVYSQTDAAAQMAGWRESWLIFAAYALVVAVAFFFCFKGKKAEA